MPDSGFQLYMSNVLLKQGKYSDVTLSAFGTTYKLHKNLIARSPYFAALLKWPENGSAQKESCDNNQVKSEDENGNEDEDEDVQTVKAYSIDDNEDEWVTKRAFELLLKRLYGCEDIEEEHKIWPEIFATSIFFDIPESVTDIIDHIYKNCSMKDAAEFVSGYQEKDYGSQTEDLKNYLMMYVNNFGWKAGVKDWDELSGDIAAMIIGGDAFYVPNEFERALFLVKLIERRTQIKKEKSEIEPLLKILNTQICFANINMKELLSFENFQDSDGISYVNGDSFLSATWLSNYIDEVISSSMFSKLKFENIHIPGKTVPKCYYSSKSINLTSTRHLEESECKFEIDNDFKTSSVPPLRFCICINNILTMEVGETCYSDNFHFLHLSWKVVSYKVDISTLRIEVIRNPTDQHPSLARINYSKPASFHFKNDVADCKGIECSPNSTSSCTNLVSDLPCYLNCHLLNYKVGGIHSIYLPQKEITRCTDNGDISRDHSPFESAFGRDAPSAFSFGGTRSATPQRFTFGTTTVSSSSPFGAITSGSSSQHTKCRHTFDIDLSFMDETAGDDLNLKIAFVLGVC